MQSPIELPVIANRPLLPNRPLDTKEVAAFFGVSSRTVEGWRRRRVGPRFTRTGGRQVRYLPGDLVSFLEEQASFGGED